MSSLRLALRTLWRSPFFATVAVASLAVGIGANLTVFALINTLLLRPLPVAESERLVRIGRTTRDARFATVSYPELHDLRTTTAGVIDLVGHYPNSVILTVGGEPHTGWIELVTGNYFTVLGISSSRGRMLTPADEGAVGASPVVVLSHQYWARRLGSDVSAIGRSVRINGRAFTVVGVAPPSFQGTFTGFSIDAWVPVTMQPTAVPSAGSVTQREDRFLLLIGRLRAAKSLADARAVLALGASRLRAAQHDTAGTMQLGVVPATGVHPFIAGVVSTFLGLLQGIVVLVLLVACVNLANVLLVRASARRRELAVRVALGATRWRIARLLLVESLLIAFLGGVCGVATAFVVARLIEQLPLDVGIPLALALPLDHRVIVAALAMTVLTALAFGAGPALSAARADALAHLRVAGATLDRRRSRVRALLVGAQVLVATVLLTGSGLMLRSLQRSARIDPGFDPTNVQLLSASPELLGYDETRGRALWQEIATRSARLAGVRAATLALFVPLGNRGDLVSMAPAGGDQPPQLLPYNIVAPGYFGALRVPLLAGREFTSADRRGAPDVVVVSTTMARRFFGGQNAVGRALRVIDRAGRERRLDVVGVVGDVKVQTMGEPARPMAYFSFGQWYRPEMVLHLATTSNSAGIVRQALTVVRSLEPDLAVDVQTMTHAMQFSLIPLRVAGSVLGFASAVGLLLASLGVFGLVAYDVSLRVREIGIRVALGARQLDVVRLTLARGLRPVLVGLAAGLVAAVGVGLVMRGLLVGVGPVDPPTFIAVVLVLLASAVGAVALPVHRALSVDPSRVLRDE